MLNKAINTKERLKALLTLCLGLAILGLFIIAFGGHRFWEKLDTYSIHFMTVKDLTPGMPVKYAGINIGRVLEIHVDDVDPSKVQVRIGVQEGFSMYQGTVAKISQKGLVGDNYVLLYLASAPGKILPVNSKIPEDTSMSIFEVAASVGNLVQNVEPSLIAAIENLNTLLATINEQDIGGLVHNMNNVLLTADNSIKNVTQEATLGIHELRATLQRMDAGVEHTKQAMLSMESAMVNFRAQSDAVGNSFQKVGAQLNESLAYDQAQIEDILHNTRELTHNLNMLSRSLRDRPWQMIFQPADGQDIRP